MNASKTPMHIFARRPQSGAALMVMLVIMIIGTAIFLVTSLSKVTLSNERNKTASDMLAQSKEVIIGYMLRGGSSMLGWMMVPDVLDVPSNSPLFPEKSPTDNSLVSNYDGEWESNCLDVTKPAAIPPYTPLTSNKTNKRCFGRLPWKSLGMSIGSPSESDPTGFMPWYAFSRNLISSFKLNGNPLQVNSELLNPDPTLYPWLKVYDMNGTLLSDRVAFVIIIPGPALPNQSRPPSPNLANPDQYLDSIALPAGCSPTGTPCTTTYRNYDLSETFVTGDEHRWINDPANPGKQIEDTTYQFNDKLLYVTIDELMPLIEKRIAREVKQCLDDYATASHNKYPWANSLSDAAYVDPTKTWNDLKTDAPYIDNLPTNIRFGRIRVVPIDSNPANSSNDPKVLAVKNALNGLQTAETNCQTNDNLQTQLADAATALLAALANISNPPFTTSFITSATAAANATGTLTGNCNYIENHGSSNSVQTNLTTAFNAFNSTTIPEDITMQGSWDWTAPSSHTSCYNLFNSAYWDDWRQLVFYQLADGYKPGTTTPTCGTSCLSASGSGNPNPGSGNYRATVIIAGKKTGGQARTATSAPCSTTGTSIAQNRCAANYLEGSINPVNKTDVPSGANALNFETYKTSDSQYQATTNDLVICVDGDINCK